MRRFLILCLTIILILGISTTAYAADMGDYGKNIALTVVYKDAGVAVVGAPVKLYKIASMDDDFTITATSKFLDFRSAIENKDTRWNVLADALTEFIENKSISCNDEAKINTSGVALFPTENNTLLPGIYLLYCPNYKFQGSIYYSSPVVISLPNYDSDGQLTNHITANIKFSSIEDQLMDLKVIKKWDDYGHENKRPKTITVELLRNGKTVSGEKKKLSKENNWTYTWTDLDPIHKWDVKELQVSGYKDPKYSSSEKNDVITITITNTFQPRGPQKLPQTGQLTWPIPLLTVIGMVLFSLGWWLCFGNRKDPYEK